MSDTLDHDKIKQLKNQIVELSLSHSEFHYQGSYEYFNLGCGLIKVGKFIDSIECFNKSISIYKENADSFYAMGFAKFLTQTSGHHDDFRESFRLRNTYQQSYIDKLMDYKPYNLILDIDDFNFRHTVNRNSKNEKLISQELKTLYTKAETFFDESDFLNYISVYNDIINLTSNAHFDYHVDLANLNFSLAQEYEKLDMHYEAIFFAGKALETDELNPHNKAYENLIAKARIKTDSYGVK